MQMKETAIWEMKGSTIWRNGRNSKTGDETTVIFPARRETKKVLRKISLPEDSFS